MEVVDVDLLKDGFHLLDLAEMQQDVAVRTFLNQTLWDLVLKKS